MRLGIAGGHGKIALLLTTLLTDRGDSVVSLIRDPGQEPEVRAGGGEPVISDLERDDAAALARALSGCDAVVFAAGAGPGSGPERKDTVDYRAAVKLIDAARRAGIDRYLMISAMAADPNHAGDQVFDVYLRAKGRADEALRESGLRSTILRPGRLTDEPPSGLVELGEAVGRGAVSRADVAATLVACLDQQASVGRTLELVGGETPLELAIASL
jgi:uncharacterized protein YbjT (DUF2867 family)